MRMPPHPPRLTIGLSYRFTFIDSGQVPVVYYADEHQADFPVAQYIRCNHRCMILPVTLPFSVGKHTFPVKALALLTLDDTMIKQIQDQPLWKLELTQEGLFLSSAMLHSENPIRHLLSISHQPG